MLRIIVASDVTNKALYDLRLKQFLLQYFMSQYIPIFPIGNLTVYVMNISDETGKVIETFQESICFDDDLDLIP